MTTIRDYLTRAQDLLESAGIENPDLDARLLVQHVTGRSQVDLLMNLNRMLTETEVKDLDAAVARRTRREPVSRITGRRGFWRSEFKVTPQTLDPRPDSETLVEAAIKHVLPAPARILDLGTGTGCLLLSLLMEWPKTTGVGLDISEEAVATARENAQSIGRGIETRVEFAATDWEAFSPAGLFELVISNPPYIAEHEFADLAPEVAQYDPHRALSGGEDGLDCYRSIGGSLKKWLTPGGWLLLEIGHAQAESVKSLLAEAGMNVLHVIPDLAGSDRVIAARRP
jgi:release factor glutamine methyltransferase